MQIELAKQYGFCFGVKRAIKIAEKSPNAYMAGPLIHNDLEISRLKQDFNVKTVKTDDFKTIPPNSKIIIRTHGIEKNDLIFFQNKQNSIVDATCPFVTKPQQICSNMSKEGYGIVIFGDAKHPEVRSVRSYADENKVHVVLDLEDCAKIPHYKKIALVSQTTRKLDEFNKIVQFFVANFKEVRVFNTICNATLENQNAAKELANRADVMIIIGGKNSSNTKQLFNICKEYCEDSYLIESESELQKEWFANKKICGITAGASTPEWIVKQIINKINLLK